MKLKDYLLEKEIKLSDFAEKIGVKSRSTISRYVYGERIPAEDVMQRIVAITEGQVTRKDFADKPHHRPSVSHPALRRERLEKTMHEESDQAYLNMLQEPPEGENEPAVITKAVSALLACDKSRLECQGGRFLLNRRPISHQQLIRRANTVLQRQGQPPLRYPGVNPVYTKTERATSHDMHANHTHP